MATIRLNARRATFTGDSAPDGMRWVSISLTEAPLDLRVIDAKSAQDVRDAASQLAQDIRQTHPDTSFIVTHRLVSHRAPPGYRRLPSTLVSVDLEREAAAWPKP